MTIPVLVSWLFLMLSIYSSLFGHVVVVVGQCLSHQQSLLLQLKHAIIFNETSSKILVNWNESSDCCTWPGITCDDDGRVIGLKLSNEGISGGIDDNSTLFNLVDLKSLDLSSNEDLQSEIPSRIEIQIVDVASNNFSGELPFQCLKTWQAMMTVAYVQKRVYITVSSLLRDESLYYEDVVTVTNKHLEMDLVKIPQGFTCIDFSSNNFYGEIPKELGLLKNLMVLNLSDNALSGHIPSSFGNMHQLESLDLSSNRLNGEIPASLSNLNFLEVLDLSHNQLSGRIPKGTQIQTFLAASFQDNEGLCGPPLTPSCKNDEVALPPKTSHEASHHNSGNKEIKWDLISAEVGFIVGFGTVIGPLVFSSKWRKRYYDRVEDIAYSILPNLLLEKWLSWKMGMRK